MATGAMRMSSTGQESQNGKEQSKTSLSSDPSLNEEQEEYLERQFQKTKNPHPSELMLIAAETGLLEAEVQTWFKKRMAMWRRDQGLNPVSSRIC